MSNQTRQHPSELLSAWMAIGEQNDWICEAVDPEFNASSFVRCDSIDELVAHFKAGNWSLGNAFYLKDLCFIQQVNAGDEYLAMKGDVPFDSVSCQFWVSKNEDEFRRFLTNVLNASSDQVKSMTHADYIQ